jgi:hypothetical protein
MSDISLLAEKMNRPLISVLCNKDWWVSTMLTTFSRSRTSPPVLMDNIDLKDFNADIVYIRLHGLPNQPFFYGSRFETTVSFNQIAQARFPDSLIFLEGCFGIRASDAFLEAGASAVYGCRIATFGHPRRIGISSRIGSRWLAQVELGNRLNPLEMALKGIREPYRIGWEKKERKI